MLNLTRTLKQGFKLKNSSRNYFSLSLNKSSKCLFSEAAFAKQQTTLSPIRQKLVFESKEERDIRFEDELFFLVRNWDELTLKKLQNHQDFTCEELTDYQDKEVEILLDHVLNFSLAESNYFISRLRKNVSSTYFNNADSQVVTYEDRDVLDEMKKPGYEQGDPDYLDKQEMLSSLLPFLSSGFLTGTSGGGNVAGQNEAPTQAAAAKPVEEAKVEKKEFEVMLKAFDAGKKIGLIKEVRGMFNLGLKEAKDLVEKAPVSLKKAVPKEEAEDMKKKLDAAGATIELA